MPDPVAPPPKGVPVWNPEGELVTIPALDDAASLQGYRPATQEDVHKEILQREYGGVGQQLATAAEAAGSQLTFGVSPKIETALGITTPEAIENRKEANPASHFLGTAGGIILPLALTGGTAAPAEGAALGAARTAARYTAPGLIAKAGHAVEGAVEGAGLPGVVGRVLPAVAGGAAEGALYGASDLNEKALLGDPHLTWEKAASELGLSALFGGALGGAGKALSEVMPKGFRQMAAEKMGTIEANRAAKAAGAIQNDLQRALKTRSQDALDDIHREFVSRDLVGVGSTPKTTLDRARVLIAKGRADANALTAASDAAPNAPRYDWDQIRNELEPDIMAGLKSKGSMAQAATAFKGKLDDFSQAYGRKILSDGTEIPARTLTVSDLHALRTDVDNSVYNFNRTLDPFTRPAAAPLKKVRDALSDKLEEAMEQTGVGANAWNEALRKQEVGIVARNYALKGLVRARGNNPISLSDTLGAVAGGAVGGGPLGAAATMAGTHLARKYGSGVAAWGSGLVRELLEKGASEEAISAATRMAGPAGGGAAAAAPADVYHLRLDAGQITKAIRDNAVAAEPHASATLRSLASDKAELLGDTGTHLPPEHSLKGAARIHDKVVKAITERLNLAPEEVVGSVKDPLRYTFRVADENYVEQANAAINRMQEKGYKVTRFRNFWKPETDPGNPYRGINVLFKTPNGTSMELQFHTPLSLATKDRIHPLYEERRRMGTPVVRAAELDKEMEAISARLPQPPGIQDFNGPTPISSPIREKAVEETQKYAKDKVKEAAVQSVAGEPDEDSAPLSKHPGSVGKPDVFAQAAAARKRIEGLSAEGEKPSEWPTKDGGRALVTKDPSKPGRWRVTKVDAAGEPTGHIEAATHHDALREAHGIGADLGSAVTAAPKAVGAETRIISPQMPQGEEAHYALVEAKDLAPSHEWPSFRPNAKYPEGVQERAYHLDKNEQMKVENGAANLNPNLLLTDTPTAVDGPPIVTSGKPIVLGGNGRTMMVQGAFEDPGKLEAYRSALAAKAAAFGVDPEQIKTMKAPVLVRQLDNVSDSSTKAQLTSGVRRFNEGMTQGLSPQARAVAEARAMSPETVESFGALLGGEDERSLRDLMRTSSSQFIGPLERDGVITAQNRGQWTVGGELTDEAKDRIEGMFLGRIVGTPDRLAATPPAVLNKLERAVPYLLRVASLNPQADAIPSVRSALDLLADAKKRRLSLGDLTSQKGLFGEETEADAEGEALAAMFDTLGPRAIGERFRQWAQVAAVDPRQGQMFGSTTTPEQLKGLLLGGTKTGTGGFADGGVVTPHPAGLRAPSAAIEPKEATEAHEKLLDLSKKADKKLELMVRAIFDEGPGVQLEGKFAHGGLVTRETYPDVATHLRDFGGNLDRLADTVSKETSSITDHAPSTATAAHAFAARVVAHLGSRLAPEPQKRLLDPSFRPNGADLQTFNRAHEVASNGPAAVLHHLRRGTLHPDHLLTSQTLFPKLHVQAQQLLAEKMAEHLGKDKRIPHRLRGSLGLFLGADLDHAHSAESIIAAQNTYAQAAAPAMPPQAQGRSRNVETHVSERSAAPSQGTSERLARP